MMDALQTPSAISLVAATVIQEKILAYEKEIKAHLVSEGLIGTRELLKRPSQVDTLLKKFSQYKAELTAALDKVLLANHKSFSEILAECFPTVAANGMDAILPNEKYIDYLFASKTALSSPALTCENNDQANCLQRVFMLVKQSGAMIDSDEYKGFIKMLMLKIKQQLTNSSSLDLTNPLFEIIACFDEILIAGNYKDWIDILYSLAWNYLSHAYKQRINDQSSSGIKQNYKEALLFDATIIKCAARAILLFSEIPLYEAAAKSYSIPQSNLANNCKLSLSLTLMITVDSAWSAVNFLNQEKIPDNAKFDFKKTIEVQQSSEYSTIDILSTNTIRDLIDDQKARYNEVAVLLFNQFMLFMHQHPRLPYQKLSLEVNRYMKNLDQLVAGTVSPRFYSVIKMQKIECADGFLSIFFARELPTKVTKIKPFNNKEVKDAAVEFIATRAGNR
jgi:hypothetical protein